MCLACEEADNYFRLQLIDQIARGEMPPGMTAEDLEAMGLPPPKPVVGGAEVEPANQPAKRPTPAANAFVCDSPDE